MAENTDLESQEKLVKSFQSIRTSLHSTIVGMDDVIDSLFWTLLCQGHGLFIGVPGLAKTLLISTLSDLLGLKFNRIQFTPDMMPSDLIGSEILEDDGKSGKRIFKFREGPLFCQLLLADEINRTPPKTQSALLQAMQEKRVTYAGKTYDLEPPFVVFATQNPIESEGTYPLPEAQLDRFLFSIPVNYPSEKEEQEIVRLTTSKDLVMMMPELKVEDLLDYQKLVRRVPIDDKLIEFAVKLVRSTRPDSSMPTELSEVIRYGAGPRASQALTLGAKARALLSGRFAVREEDILAVAPYVLKHRLVLRRLRDRSADQVVDRILELSA
ncbi:MAG: moxR [Bacteriovoracaceae bacterium]|nr:moxR [Bacteriovoracaceae bacterium]